MSVSRQTLSSVKADFDRIALVDDEVWNHNVHYHDYLLKQIPAGCKMILEIGCGTGGFSRALANRAERVVAIDLSHQMVNKARERSPEYSNIEFVAQDVMDRKFTDEEFDCIATLTTLHHLPMRGIIEKMKRALGPGGVFVCLDLYQRATATDWLLDFIAFPASLFQRFIKTGNPMPSKEIRNAYAEHGKTDTYLTFQEVKRICAELIPGARVRRHLFWRYSIVWKKGL